jgi:hypothetical protein
MRVSKVRRNVTQFWKVWADIMKKADAMSLSIGALGALDTYLTATILPLPVFVTFIAWASFFILGGGIAGLKQSIACNLLGIAIASATLLASLIVPESKPFLALCVGLGSAAMVQASKLPLFAPTPAVVWGFASTVATFVASAVPIQHAGLTNPGLVAAAAMIVGALFGYASEVWGNAMIKAPGVSPAVSQTSRST